MVGERTSALVVSIDFELIWGVRDLYPADGGSYRANVLGARSAILRMLDLFEEYDVRATWAAVGFLFASSAAEAEKLSPDLRPVYDDARLDPYPDVVGGERRHGELRWAPEILAEIARRPGQEIGSHTFSHFYPLEPGADLASFRADLLASVRVNERFGVRPTSLIIPRNQFSETHLPIIAEAGFTSVRSNAAGSMHRAARDSEYRRQPVRMQRLVDAYAPLSGDQVIRRSAIATAHGVAAIPASHFVRPYLSRLRRLEPLRHRRIAATLRAAGRTGGICHVWWHPHNFGINQDENLQFLRGLLDVYRDEQRRHGMRSMTMSDVAENVLGRPR